MDVVYVPIGMGSGAASAIIAKLALGHKAKIVGVVSSHATSYADSIAAGRVIESLVTTQLADGMACRTADQEALDVLIPHVDHIALVTDDEVAAAMQERVQLKGLVVGTTLCGDNVDAAVFAKVVAL